ncbi:unnamed protein product, partial [Symbiodinium microadriaticum]
RRASGADVLSLNPGPLEPPQRPEVRGGHPRFDGAHRHVQGKPLSWRRRPRGTHRRCRRCRGGHAV